MYDDAHCIHMQIILLPYNCSRANHTTHTKVNQAAIWLNTTGIVISNHITISQLQVTDPNMPKIGIHLPTRTFVIILKRAGQKAKRVDHNKAMKMDPYPSEPGPAQCSRHLDNESREFLRFAPHTTGKLQPREPRHCGMCW